VRDGVQLQVVSIHKLVTSKERQETTSTVESVQKSRVLLGLSFVELGQELLGVKDLLRDLGGRKVLLQLRQHCVL